ncbi:phage tail protein [Actinoplanes sp. NPDC051861]|uniref:phage tail protein n=1 Tax=Actinoplanes sp. NPDC051861 TaxID=3155170 RepID=UPI00342CEA37
MQPRSPTSLLLGGSAGWPAGTATGVAVGTSLELSAVPDGPRGVAGLLLPARVAADRHGTVLLLHRRTGRVLRLDRSRREFVGVPDLGGRGRDARRFRRPAALAIAGHDLHVADRGNRRVQTFDLRSLTLARIWQLGGWDPADVAGRYILDAAHGRIHHADGDVLRPVVARPEAAGRWSRIAVDRHGLLYALDAGAGALDVFEPDGTPAGRVTAAGAVRDRFDPPAVRLDNHGRLVVSGLDDLRFDRAGRVVTRPPDEPAGPDLHSRGGSWISPALDSAVHRCQWHRVDLDIAALPAGTSVVVSTFSAAEPQPGPRPDSTWQTERRITGRVQPTGESDAARDEFLVQSRPGRYLWIRVELRGDGHATPSVAAARAHFPRESYLEHLPAVFSADEESRWFLERYLSIAQTEWDAISERTRTVERNFAPASAPEEFLRYLCSWLALPVERDWTPPQLRGALAAAGRFYPRRGTAAAIREWLTVYLEAMTGHRPADDGYPRLIEGHTTRRWYALGGPGPAPLWGPAVVGRLQLDVFSREGEVRLVSTGDPERDVFHEYAHRFSVFLPASWVRTEADETLVRRCVDAERPAHTSYQICLVEARTRVGVQSTVGVDTIVAARPHARLACRHDDRPPSRAPQHRLGFDMVLAAAPALGPGRRIDAPRAHQRHADASRTHQRHASKESP